MPILNNINPEDLDQFIGTTAYYRNTGTRKNANDYGGGHTDGCHMLYENGMAWFIDHVSLYYPSIKDRFQVWKITPDAEGSGADISVEDGNDNNLKVFKLEYAEICCLNKPDHFQVWCVDGVIMLPSEY